MKFVVITTARNEGKYIGETLRSVVSQTVLPNEWVIVDDGSTDETPQIVETFSRKFPWIKLIKRHDRGYRSLGSGDIDAFYEGFKKIIIKDHELLFKIDADIVLGKKYFQGIIEKFSSDSELGIGVGQVYEVIEGKLFKMGTLPYGFNGMVKCWHKKCFQDIDGIEKGPGWDGLDCFKAMRLGWKTQTFEDEELKVIHLRPEGSSIQSRYKGWARHGKALYFIGAHPVWVLASAFYHLRDRPLVLGGLYILIGYLESVIERTEQYEDPEFRRFLHAWQLKKLGEILRLR